MFVHGYLGRSIASPPVILAGSAGANQTYDFRPDTFVDVTDVIEGVSNWLTKLDGLLTDGSPVDATLVLKHAGKTLEMSRGAERVVAARTVWGEMSGVRYAEAFRAIRKGPSQLW